jgi:hypothetical protein
MSSTKADVAGRPGSACSNHRSNKSFGTPTLDGSAIGSTSIIAIDLNTVETLGYANTFECEGPTRSLEARA